MRPSSDGAAPSGPDGATGRAEAGPGERTEWLVDGYNVVQVSLLGGADRTGWWRGEARSHLLDLTASLTRPDLRLLVVFDGADPAPPVDPHRSDPQAVFAPSADDWILRRTKQRGAAGADTVVVTADRRLADRCRHAGARVETPGAFVDACRSASEARSPGTQVTGPDEEPPDS